MPLTAARRALLESMGHDEIIDSIAKLAHGFCWLAFTPRTVELPSGEYLTAYRHHSGKGFPDMCLVGHGWVLFVEVKTGTGRLEPEQINWQETIFAAEEHNPDSRVLYVQLRPHLIPKLEQFLETWRYDDLVATT